MELATKRDAIAELEAWNNECKARWVDIHHDNGYGASCWMVELHEGENVCVYSQEVRFIEGKLPKNCVVANKEGELNWPGLSRTILAAIDHWNIGHTKP